MRQAEAHGLMDELVAAFEAGVLPFGTELYLVKRGGDHGIRIRFEESSVDYFDSEALAHSIRTYTEKLKRVEDADPEIPLLELLKPEGG